MNDFTPQEHSAIAGTARIAFLFPGQGAQQPGLAQDLYQRIPAYTKAFDECLDLFQAADVPLRRWWRASSMTELRSPRGALPLTFAVEHALVQMWQSWGITPDAVVGSSIGEMAAGLVAGVFSLDDAVRAVAIRAQALEDLPAGGLVAVSATTEQVQPLLPDDIWIAVITSPQQLVVAGATGPLAEAVARLEQAGLACRQVRASHAAHGPGVAAAVPVFDQAMRGLRLAPPMIDFYSANTGQLVSASEATDPAFWSRQLAQPVLFADALDALTDTADPLMMIEAGPGQMLAKQVRRHPKVAAGRHRVVPTLAHRPMEPLAQVRSVLAAVALVRAAGHTVDGAGLTELAALGLLGSSSAEPLDLPGTVDRLRHLWVAVLGTGESIGQDADFFDLGGDSLTAVELMEKVRAEFDVNLGVVALFDHPRLDALAGQIFRRIG